MFRSAPEECPLKDGNILNVKLFVQDDTQCRSVTTSSLYKMTHSAGQSLQALCTRWHTVQVSHYTVQSGQRTTCWPHGAFLWYCLNSALWRRQIHVWLSALGARTFPTVITTSDSCKLELILWCFDYLLCCMYSSRAIIQYPVYWSTIYQSSEYALAPNPANLNINLLEFSYTLQKKNFFLLYLLFYSVL
jgi:hypothetical protein